VTEQPPTPENAPAPSSQGEAEPTQAGNEPAPLAEEVAAVEPPPPPAEESPTVVQPAPPEPPAAVEPPPPPPVAPPPPVVPPPPAPPPPVVPPPPAPPPSFGTDSGPAAAPRDKPEIPIAGAFVAGFVLALILKRLAR
jgi:hypothetical protein